MKTQLLTALSIGVLLATSAHADVAGQSSNESYIKVGGTKYNGTGHGDSVLGSPGIGIYNSKTPFKQVAISKFQGMVKWGIGGSYDKNKDVSFIDESNGWMPPSHKNFGYFAFSDIESEIEAGDNKVYFGEWSDEDDVTDGSHTVYYVGKDKTSNMPSTGTATYSVRGINNARNTNPLTGKLNANFGTNKIGGNLSNNTISLVIDNNTINPSTASFSGKATANGNNGNSQGKFFGNEAATLGGIATFNDKSLDTAFAGKRGPINR